MHRFIKYFGVLLGLSILTSSCNSDNAIIEGIYGEWNWERSVGHFGTWTPASTGDSKRLEFDHFYCRQYLNDSLVLDAQYDLVVKEEPIDGLTQFLTLDSVLSFGIGISTTELVLIEFSWNDGSTHYYKRN